MAKNFSRFGSFGHKAQGGERTYANRDRRQQIVRDVSAASGRAPSAAVAVMREPRQSYSIDEHRAKPLDTSTDHESELFTASPTKIVRTSREHIRMATRARHFAGLTKMSFARPLCFRLPGMDISIVSFPRQQIVRDVSAASGRAPSAAVAVMREPKQSDAARWLRERSLHHRGNRHRFASFSKWRSMVSKTEL